MPTERQEVASNSEHGQALARSLAHAHQERRAEPFSFVSTFTDLSFFFYFPTNLEPGVKTNSHLDGSYGNLVASPG